MAKLFDAFPEALRGKVSYKTKNNTKNKSKSKSIQYAFDRLRKLPLESDRNVKSAMNHFFNVKGATEEEKHQAFKKIINKANYFKICTMAYTEKYDKYCSSINSKESEDN